MWCRPSRTFARLSCGGAARRCDPGGYRWKDGIGDRDRRTPFPNKVWGRIDPNDVGIDEFCQLCELTGVEPLICLSFSDGPQSAADLVAYCNGDNEHALGSQARRQRPCRALSREVLAGRQ